MAFIAVAAGAWRRPRPGDRAALVEPGAADGDAEVPLEPTSRFWKLLRRVDHWQRERWGWSLVFGVIKKFGDDRAGYLAALVSYYAFFSVLPLVLALTSILGFVLEGNESLQDDIRSSALKDIPFLVGGDEVTQAKGSVVALVIGIAGSLWAGLRVIDAIQNALNEVWDVPVGDRPNMVKRRARGLVALGLLGAALLVSLAASSLARYLPQLPGEGRYAVYGVTLVFNIGLFLVAFRVLSRVDHTWGELVPGSIFAAVGWFAIQNYGAIYFNRIKDANVVSRDIGAVLVALAFFFLVAQVVVLAAELNVVLARRLWPRSLFARPGDLTEADRRVLTDSVLSQRRVRGQRIAVSYPPERPAQQ